MAIPLVDIQMQYEGIKAEINDAVQAVLDSGKFILGPFVEELERNIAKYSGTKHAIGVASGTDALLLSLKAIGITTGDEVIIPPFTFFATAGAIYNAGGKPVFCDIDERTYNINPDLLESVITPRTKAIIPVHLYGQCSQMDQILAIASAHNLFVIEDAAQSLGAMYNEKKAGSMGDMGCFSFFPTKNLGGYGDGGMVVTNDDKLAKRVKMLRVHGEESRYHHAEIGINSRLDALQAAIVRAKLPYLEQWNKKRRKNADLYNEVFNGTAIIRPVESEGNYCIYNQYTIQLSNRDKVKQMLTEKMIASAIYYPVPLHLQKCFKYLDYHAGDFPISEKSAEHVLSLPIYPELVDGQVEKIGKIVLSSL